MNQGPHGTILVVLGFTAVATILTFFCFRKKARDETSDPAKPLETPEPSPEPCISTFSPIEQELREQLQAMLKAAAVGHTVNVRRLQNLAEKFREDAQIVSLQRQISNALTEWQFARNFRTNKFPQTSTTARIVRRAYWDKHREDLHIRRDFRFVFERVQEFVELVKSFAVTDAVLDARIRQIDFAFIQQQLEFKSFDWSCFVELVGRLVSLLDRVESAAAHEHTKAFLKLLEDGDDVSTNGVSSASCRAIDVIEFLFNQLDNLALEVRNFRSATTAPETKEAMERDAFWGLVEVVGLEAVANMRKARNGQMTEQALYEILIELVIGNQPIHECMQLDLDDLRKFRNSAKCLIRLATLLTVFRALHDAQSLWSKIIADASETEIVHLVLASISADRAFVDAAVRTTWTGENAVARIFTDRLAKALMQDSGSLGDSPKLLVFVNLRVREFKQVLKSWTAVFARIYCPIYARLVDLLHIQDCNQ